MIKFIWGINVGILSFFLVMNHELKGHKIYTEQEITMIEKKAFDQGYKSSNATLINDATTETLERCLIESIRK